jgi:hypothetical protein
VHFEYVVAGFSRCHQYTLDSELREQGRMVVSAMVRSNSEVNKPPVPGEHPGTALAL